MDRLDTGVVLCQLAEALQEKMVLADNGKVRIEINITFMGSLILSLYLSWALK